MGKNNERGLYLLQSINSILKDTLVSNGFRKRSGLTYIRLMNGYMFQCIDFQKDWNGDPRFTVNITVWPLFRHSDTFLLVPGNRMNIMTHGNDKWWAFDTIDDSNQSITDVKEQLIDSVLPMFDDLSTSDRLIQQYYDRKYNIKWASEEVNGLKLLGYLYLHASQNEMALELFLKAMNIYLAKYEKLKYEWMEEAYIECKTMAEIIEKCPEKIQDKLDENTEFTCQAIHLRDREKYYFPR